MYPLHGLKPQWLSDTNDGSAEFRLAASLAGMALSFGKGRERIWFRQHLEPLQRFEHGEYFRARWSEKKTDNDVVWHEGDLADSLNAILARRLIRVEKSGACGWPDFSPCVAKLQDITDFIEGRTNDALLADLIWGLSLVDWEAILRTLRSEKAARLAAEANAASHTELEPDMDDPPFIPPKGGTPNDDEQEAIPSAFYALLRLCFRAAKTDETIPLDPRILHRAMNGDGTAAAELAARRLRASGKAPLVTSLPVRGDIARRTAAAMLFPIGYRDFRLLEHMILKQPNQQNT